MALQSRHRSGVPSYAARSTKGAKKSLLVTLNLLLLFFYITLPSHVYSLSLTHSLLFSGTKLFDPTCFPCLSLSLFLSTRLNSCFLLLGAGERADAFNSSTRQHLKIRRHLTGKTLNTSQPFCELLPPPFFFLLNHPEADKCNKQINKQKPTTYLREKTNIADVAPPTHTHPYTHCFSAVSPLLSPLLLLYSFSPPFPHLFVLQLLQPLFFFLKQG